MSNLEAACNHSSKAASACPFPCSREFSATSIRSKRQRGSDDLRGRHADRRAKSRAGRWLPIGPRHRGKNAPTAKNFPRHLARASAVRRFFGGGAIASARAVQLDFAQRCSAHERRSRSGTSSLPPANAGRTRTASRRFSRHGSFRSPAAWGAQHPRKIPASGIFLSFCASPSVELVGGGDRKRHLGGRFFRQSTRCPIPCKREGAERHEEPAGIVTFIAARRKQARE